MLTHMMIGSFMKKNTCDIAKNHLLKNIQSLSSLKNFHFDKCTLEKFCNHRVIFCTMGKSAYACRKIVHSARSFGLDWHDLDVCHAFHGDAGLIKNEDLLVFVSKSGNTRETLAVAEHFKNHETVGICSHENSKLPLLCKSNIIIPVSDEGSPYDLAPMISTSLYMTILHSILCSVVVNKGIKLEEFAKNHPSGSIGKKLRDINA